MPVHPPTLTHRPERPEDEPLLFQLYASSRQEELDPLNWPPEMRAAFLTMQFRAQRQGYASMFPKAEFQIILLNGREAGRMVVDRAAEEIRLVDLVLLPEFRNSGVGTELLTALSRDAAAARKPLRLSVAQGNRALRFYERLGFRKTGVTGVHDEMEWRAPQTPENK